MKALLAATSWTLRKPTNVPTIFWNNAGRSTLGQPGEDDDDDGDALPVLSYDYGDDDDDDGNALPVLSEHWNANLPTGSISPSLLCLCRSIQQPNVLLIIKSQRQYSEIFTISVYQSCFWRKLFFFQFPILSYSNTFTQYMLLR